VSLEGKRGEGFGKRKEQVEEIEDFEWGGPWGGYFSS